MGLPYVEALLHVEVLDAEVIVLSWMLPMDPHHVEAEGVEGVVEIGRAHV